MPAAAVHCTAQSILHLVVPFTVFGIVTSYLAYRKWSAKKNGPDPEPLSPNRWSAVVIKVVQFTLGLVEVVGWTYLLVLRQGKTTDDVCHSLGPLVNLIIWLAISVFVVTAPPYNEFRSEGYIHAFTLYYFYFLLDGIYNLLFADTYTGFFFLADWVLIDVLITALLFVLLGTISPPLDPRNAESQPSEKLEIKEGWVYRNNLPLSPEATASIFSWASFQWVNPLVVYGANNLLKTSDLYALTYKHLTRFAYADFVTAAKNTSRTNILLRLYRANWGAIWVQLIFSTASVFAGYLGPYFQQLFLEYIENPAGRPVKVAYVYVFGLFSVAVVKTLCDSLQLWAGRRWNIRTMAMLDSELLDKTLKRRDMSGKVGSVEEEQEEEEGKEVDPKKAKEDKQKKEEANAFSNTGKITNLMAIDADTLSTLPSYIFMFYNAPVQVIVAVVFLYNVLGSSALVGLSVMILSFPFTWWLTSFLTKNYEELSSARDRRSDLINELLQGIRMIKYFAWEKNWAQKVIEARNIEIKRLIRTLVFEILTSLVFTALPVVVTASTFIWYTKVQGHTLTASVAFVSITLFDMLRQPMYLIPDSIDTFSQAYVSLKRLRTYLEEPEVDDGTDQVLPLPSNSLPSHDILSRVGFEKSVFQWHSGKPAAAATTDASSASSSTEEATVIASDSSAHAPFQLNIPALDFPIGKLSIICGVTGSGKSSFLNALLGEMDIVSGRVYLPSKTRKHLKDCPTVDPVYPSLYLDKVAYVAQQPFLQHASIRDNILFGLPFDRARYKKVLAQCALVKDLSLLADGDRTEIGEKGISLSGGQKQRVSIARAVYSYAKTVLLDDCLSAVDAHTAKHIYEHCLSGDLLKGRTVILVTHHVRLCLPSAKFLVKLENGNVVEHGSVETLRQAKKINQIIGTDTEADNVEEEEIEEAEEEETEPYNEEFELADDQADTKKLVEDEKSEKGSVKFQVYKTYLAACGGLFFWGALYGSYIIARGFDFGENWWLRVWAVSNVTQPHDDLNQPDYMNLFAIPQTILHKSTPVIQTYQATENQPKTVNYYIGIYLIICFSGIIFNSLRSILLYYGSIRGAKKLFAAMLDRIIHAPLRFFDTTPVGRILNRFGQDFSVIDMQMARSASFMIACMTGFVVAIAVIAYITPQFLGVAVIILGLYYIIGVYYLRISRELKRFTSISRSPIYSHFTESLIGVTTIRAYGLQERFLYTIYERLDAYIGPFYLLWMANRWLYARIEFAGAFVTLSAGVFILMSLDRVDAGMAGISLFYARNFLEQTYWFIRQYTQVEMNLNSVERVQEYLQIDQEPSATIENRRPPAAWPTTAAVEVKDLVVRYAPDLDPVLHGISFSVRPHEKVGIVGRTGSGKSTLALSFFRFLEASSGSIAIDGIDISHIGVHDLRSNLTIIPQDAVLFSGTIRSNLDPFNEHDDAEIWESLRRVHIISAQRGSGSNTPTNSASDSITSLSQPVSDGGNNFSQGQRQLLCLARALLKNSKLIIMDEATASVDFETDGKIQTTIREEFVNSSLLCIAHRLRTVIDYDRVLVLDQGNVVEYDTPYNLLVNNAGLGIFRSMCEQSGEMDILLDMAQQSASRSQDDFPVADHHSLI
ncbi:hypothetical protein EC973_006818 [Apophysomyces ossiformis]|uniref:P-loop containing nucleoside triphosphate hydrolase protein n=1 Tax=Apophysomyces ossiformis TaxID=679940 RepID=A0A8H7BQ10_9FUNG|nr:hypothetical protein EC973_006818 [Apophysomyces ossiformis]